MKMFKKPLDVLSSPKSIINSSYNDDRGSCDKKYEANGKKPTKLLQKYYININYSSNAMKNEEVVKRLTLLTTKNTLLERSLDKTGLFGGKTKLADASKLNIVPKRIITSPKNLNLKEDNSFSAINRPRKEDSSVSKKTPISLAKAHGKRPSMYYVCTPGNAYTGNSSKLRIVSRDKCARKSSNSKIFQISLDDRKNSVSTKKSVEKATKAIKPPAVELYMRLEKLVSAKSRSIDMNVNNFKKGGRTNNLIVSEDKDQTKYMVADKPFNFTAARKESNEVGANQRSTSKERRTNKYYLYLCDKLKSHSDVKRVSEVIRSHFRTWKNGDVAEFFEFKTSIDFYKIKQKIGKGCFGKVYQATQMLTNTPVALKAIPKINIKNKDTRKKIEKEVEILKKINNSDHVIKLFEVFEDSSYVYLVCEYLENGDLIKYFKVNPLFDEPEERVFFKKIAKGVEYLHSNNIIHRDLKLDNILLDRKMNPKICDFGISSIQEPGKKIYDTGGTPAYLAPEVVKAEGEVGPKSDVWSLGVLLYLLTFGIVPFKANDMQLLYNKIIVGKFKFPEFEYASPELIELIKSMLVVDVNARISLKEVLKHRWFQDHNISLVDQKNFQINKSKELLKKEAVMLYLEDLGFPAEFITQTTNKNLFNHVKACIDSLLEKFTDK